MDKYPETLLQTIPRLTELMQGDRFRRFCALVKVHRKVVLLAVGKSFLAVQLSAKIANSYGIKWYALNALDALHGDLGVVGTDDLVVFVSKSGETEELLRLAELLPDNLVITLTFGLFGNSLLRKANPFHFNFQISEENSVFGHAPITSTVLIQLFLNTVVQNVVDDVYIEDFAKNHTAGSIGQALAT